MPTLPVVQPTNVAAPVSQVAPLRFEVRGA
jgi:hypothetical protein